MSLNLISLENQMKNSRNLREAQEEYKERVVGLCCVCQKPVTGFYGRWADSGTCSRPCEIVQEAKPKYPEKGEKLCPPTSS